MQIRCRTCESVLPAYELTASGGSSIGFRMSASVEQSMEESTQAWVGTEEWLQCRYLDGYPCFDCGTVELGLLEPRLMLKLDGQEWPRGAPDCPACKLPSRGPRAVAMEGSPEPVLARLADQFGAPIQGRLCESCWRVWLSLEPDDSEGRVQLAARVPDRGPCIRCDKGRIRTTCLDVPHFGVARLGFPSHEGTRRLEWEESRIRVAVCDSCGEAGVVFAGE